MHWLFVSIQGLWMAIRMSYFSREWSDSNWTTRRQINSPKKNISAHGRVFSALGHCNPTLVVSAKAESRVQVGKFQAQEKMLHCLGSEVSVHHSGRSVVCLLESVGKYWQNMDNTTNMLSCVQLDVDLLTVFACCRLHCVVFSNGTG